ncbi:type IX secretion system outer membrane channel protein PorV [Solitalea sp. MAHUQ-68]|uniref:Type IX secretion system outer membrane channel protein PorV n=1 Tax=Solitalea agri TaxID=2953739 RepID=A0A9X2JCR1_9SPHI|nr:type IX secretion system outer membrane channel protein PorV [Solitalea agri]MCO4292809.1 type IX secretion system outer membrane channel protein PorV [Solitalea agri]
MRFLSFISSVSLVSFSLLFEVSESWAQNVQTDGRTGNSITTAVPFLLIGPDSRAGGMGDAGGATSPDVSSMHWNPAKYAFCERKAGVGLDYSPWLRSLGIQDITLAYLSGYYKIDDQQTLASSIRYFSLGELTFTDNTGQAYGQYSPNEYAIDASYIRKLSEYFSMAIAARFIHSNLGSGNISTIDYNPGSAFACDVAVYYNKDVSLFNTDANVAWGANISNIGTKMQYGTEKNFLPTNLRLSGATTFKFNEANSLSLTLDMNKLLVPTNPIYDDQGNIIVGEDPDKTVPEGIFGSFSDAPGGFKEELQEINFATGLEYWYNDIIALRTGYFYENPYKGNRQYVTLGAGLKYEDLCFDFSYLIPGKQNNPLEKTLRFSLLFNFGRKKS